MNIKDKMDVKDVSDLSEHFNNYIKSKIHLDKKAKNIKSQINIKSPNDNNVLKSKVGSNSNSNIPNENIELANFARKKSDLTHIQIYLKTKKTKVN